MSEIWSVRPLKIETPRPPFLNDFAT